MNGPPPTPPPAESFEVTVPDDAVGERLDRWISTHASDLSRSRIQKLIDADLVEVNGRPRSANYRIRSGDVLRWQVPPPSEVSLEPDPSVPFRIVHEDEEIAIVDKPAGVVVHPATGHRQGTLVHGLMARLSSLSGVGGRARPGIVHRLDADTSGLLAVAKTDRAHHSLQNQLRERTLGRTYAAICWGRLREIEGVIDAPLDRDPRERRRRAVVEGGRPARTHWWVEERGEGATRLRLQLETGRTHQIRVHLLHVGHPVLGDALYHGDRRRMGGASPQHRPRLARALAALRRQALHAEALDLVHPATGEKLHFQSPWPEDMLRAWALLRSPESRV